MAEGKLGITVVLNKESDRVFKALNDRLDEVNKKTELNMSVKSANALKDINSMLHKEFRGLGIDNIVGQIMQMNTTTKSFEKSIALLRNTMKATSRYFSDDFIQTTFARLTNKQKFNFMDAVYKTRKVEIYDAARDVKTSKDRNKKEMAAYLLNENMDVKTIARQYGIEDEFLKDLNMTVSSIGKNKRDYKAAIKSLKSLEDINNRISKISQKAKEQHEFGKLYLPLDQLIVMLEKLDKLQAKINVTNNDDKMYEYLDQIEDLVGERFADLPDYRKGIKYIISRIAGEDVAKGVFNAIYGEKINNSLDINDFVNDETNSFFVKGFEKYALAITDPKKYKQKKAIETAAQKATKEEQNKKDKAELVQQELMQKALDETSKKYLDISEQVKKYAVSLDDAFDAANKLFEMSGNGANALLSKDEMDFFGFYQRYLSMTGEENVDKDDPIYKMYQKRKIGRNKNIASNVNDFTIAQLETYNRLKDGVSSINTELSGTEQKMSAITQYEQSILDMQNKIRKTASYSGMEELLWTMSNGIINEKDNEFGVNQLTYGEYGRPIVDKNNPLRKKLMPLKGVETVAHTHPFLPDYDNLRFSWGDLRAKAVAAAQEALLLCGEEVLSLRFDPNKFTTEVELEWYSVLNAIFARFGAVIKEVGGVIVNDLMTNEQRNAVSQMWNSYLSDQVKKLGGSVTTYKTVDGRLQNTTSSRIGVVSDSDMAILKEFSDLLNNEEDDKELRKKYIELQKKHGIEVSPFSYADDKTIDAARKAKGSGDTKEFNNLLANTNKLIEQQKQKNEELNQSKEKTIEIDKKLENKNDNAQSINQEKEKLDVVKQQAKTKEKVIAKTKEETKAIQENVEAERKYSNLTDKELDHQQEKSLGTELQKAEKQVKEEVSSTTSEIEKQNETVKKTVHSVKELEDAVHAIQIFKKNTIAQTTQSEIDKRINEVYEHYPELKPLRNNIDKLGTNNVARLRFYKTPTWKKMINGLNANDVVNANIQESEAHEQAAISIEQHVAANEELIKSETNAVNAIDKKSNALASEAASFALIGEPYGEPAITRDALIQRHREEIKNNFSPPMSMEYFNRARYQTAKFANINIKGLISDNEIGSIISKFFNMMFNQLTKNIGDMTFSKLINGDSFNKEVKKLISNGITTNLNKNNGILVGEPYSNDFVLVDNKSRNYKNRKLKNGNAKYKKDWNIERKKLKGRKFSFDEEDLIFEEPLDATGAVKQENQKQEEIKETTNLLKEQAEAQQKTESKIENNNLVKQENQKQEEIKETTNLLKEQAEAQQKINGGIQQNGKKEGSDKSDQTKAKISTKKPTKKEQREIDKLSNNIVRTYNGLTDKEYRYQLAMLKKNSGKNLSDTDSKFVQTYEEQLEKAKKLMSQLDSSSVDKASDAWRKAAESVENYNNKVESVKSKINGRTEEDAFSKNTKATQTSIDKTIKEIENYINKFNKYKQKMEASDFKFIDNNQADEAFIRMQNEASRYEDLINRLRNIDPKSPFALQALEQIKGEFDTLISKTEEFKKNTKNLIDVSGTEKAKKALSDIRRLLSYDKISSSHYNQLKGYEDKLSSSTGLNENELNNIISNYKQVNKEMNVSGEKGLSFLDKVKNRFQSLGSYLTTFVSFYRVVYMIKDMLNTIKELDTALFEMRKVSSESIETLKQYQKESFEIGKSIGTDALSLQKSVADWMRLGETFEQAKESAKVSNILLNVSEFSSIDEATTSLVAISKAYEDVKTGIDKMDIIDKLNAIGDNYAISTDGVATALQDSASALTTAGNDMNEALALIAAGNTVTQDPSKTGKAVRTIALRLTGTKEAKAELEELGEDTEGYVETQSKLRDVILSATKVSSNQFKGFDILDKNGNYKSTYEIMLGIAEIYDEIVKSDKELGTNKANLLLENLAGKNRANVAASILQNSEILKQAYNTAAFEYEGVAAMEQEKYLDSLEAKITQLNTAYQELGSTAVKSDFLKSITELGTTGVEGLTKYIDKFGILASLIPAVLGYSGVLGGGLFNVNKFGNVSSPIFDAFKKTEAVSLTKSDNTFLEALRRSDENGLGVIGDKNKVDAFASLTAEEFGEINNQIREIAYNSKSFSEVESRVNVLTTSTSKAKDMFKQFGATVANIGVNMLAGIAIDVAIKGITYLADHIINARKYTQQAMDDAKSSIEQANSSFEAQSASIENVKKRYAELSEGVKVTSNEIKNMSLSDDEFSEYLNLNKELYNMAPELASGFDTQGNALINLGNNYIEVSNNIDEYIEKLREARNLEAANNMGDLFKGTLANVKDFQKEKDSLERQNKEFLSPNTEAVNNFKSGFYNGAINADFKNIDNYEKILKKLGIQYSKVVEMGENDIAKGFIISINSNKDQIKAAGEQLNNVVEEVYGGSSEITTKAIGDNIEKINDLTEKQKIEWQKSSEYMLEALQSTDEYKLLSDDASDAFQSVFNNLDFGSIIENNGFETWFNAENWFKDNLISPISNIAPQINDAFDMKEAFDNNEVSAKEYTDNINELFNSELIQSLPKEIQDSIKNSLTYTSEDGKNIGQMTATIADKINGSLSNYLKDGKTTFDYLKDNKPILDYLGELSKEDLELALKIVQPGMTLQELQSEMQETKEQAAEGVDLEARTGIENYEKAKEKGSYLDDYNKYITMLKEGKEFYENGQIGNETFQAIAKAFSVNGMEDVTNWLENSGQLGKYFTEDARDGLQLFLEDLHGIGAAAQDADGSWELTFDDMEQAANDLYMPFEMLNVLLSGLQEYGFTNDFFTTTKEGAEHLVDLLERREEVEEKIRDMEDNPDNYVDKNGNVLQALKDEADQLDASIESTKKHLEELAKMSVKDATNTAKKAEKLLDVYNEELKTLDLSKEYASSVQGQVISEMQTIAKEAHTSTTVDLQIDNPNITSEINQTGKLVVDVVVNGEEDLESAEQAQEELEAAGVTNIEYRYHVVNPELTDEVEEKTKNLENSECNITVTVDDQASDGINNVEKERKNLDGKTATTHTVNSDSAIPNIRNISSALDKLDGKTARTYTYHNIVTTKKTVYTDSRVSKQPEKGAVSIGTTGFVSSHANGTVLGGMKAYFGGHNIALSEDQKALVGEEGMEGLVRDGQFYLIGKNSPEIRALKKGDIIFSAKQTKAILNGQKTSRGKTIGMPSHADGTTNILSKGYITAFADGLMHAYAGTGGSRGPSLGSSKSSSSSSSNPSTKSTNNNTKAVKENTKSNKNKTKSTKKNTQSLDKLQKKWDALEDWIDDWLSAWDRVYNELDQYASEIHQTYGKQNAYIDKMYTKIDEYNKNYSAMYNKYMSQAAASGLSQTYIKKIQDGTIDIETLKTKNKKGKTSLGNEKLVAQIEEYKRWYDLAQGVKEKLLELRAVQAELANQKLTNIQDDHDKSVDMLSNTVDYYKQRIELIKTLGESYKSTNHLELDGNSLYSGRTRFDTSHTDYNVNLGLSYGLALDNQRKVVQMHQKEYDELLKEFNKLVKAGKIVEGSDTWKEWKATLTGLQTTIMADKQAFLELKEELMDYHWEAFNKNIETINYSLKEFDDILEHINSENLFNDKGVLTKEGLGYIGTVGLAMSEAKQKLVDYQNAVKTLEQQYKNGNISQETYTEKLREYLDAIRSASNEVDNYKDKLIDLYKNQMQAENDALKENISLRQESLKRLREYETYAKTIRNKNKDINALQAQIASLSGVSTQEGRAELARLRAQLQEAQEDLSDTQQEHRWDMMEQGFSDMAENADKTLDDVTKNLERNSDLQTKIVNQMLDKIKNSYKQTYSEINKIITDAGIVLSERTEKDVKDLSNKNTAATEMNKAEGTVSYDNNKDKSTGTVKPDSITKAVKTKIELNSLTMNKTKTSIYVGASEKLTASKVPSTAQTGGITWSSSNTKVATVSGGTVKGVAAGSATITATCDGKTATCTVTVSKKPAAKKSTTTKPTTTTATTKNGESPTKKEQTALSWHKNGVAVRASASEKSKKITAVPYNKRATLVLDSKGKQQTKNGGGYTWIKVKYAGKTGWAKKKFLKFAKGAKRIDEDQIGITQDAGAELIMSRGRMLVPTQLYKGDTVYPNDITEKLWDIGKLGTEGIKEKIERDLQIKIPNGLNGIKENTENNFGDYNVTINALQKLDRKEIQQLSDYFYNDWYKRMKKDLVASGIKR